MGEWLAAITPQLESPASSVGASIVSGAGVMLNGPPPPVANNLYRRHRIRIKEILANDGKDYLNQTITVAGWARTTRNANKGQLLFVELNDGSTGESLQCVLDVEKSENFEECKASGGTGASFQLVGTLIPSQGAGQAVELAVTIGKLLGAVYGGDAEGTVVGGASYPMSKKAHTLEYMREHAHLRPRGRIHAAAMRIRHAMAYATHTFFHNHGFLYIHTPILTGADCEGAGEQFGVTTLLGSDHLEKDVTLPVHEPPPVSIAL
jgi:asparaginyl-tRNA synthetase